MLTLSYSSKINSYLYLQRVFLPLKKKCYGMFSEGNAAHPNRHDSSLQTVMAVWRPSNLKKVCQTAVLYYLERVVTPYQITQQIVCRGQEGLICRPIQDLGFFLSQCHYKIQEDCYQEIQV